MSDIKRYRLDTDSFAAEHPQGDFVDYKDYAHLRAEVDNLRKNADISPSQSPHEIDRLKAEVERLRTAQDSMADSIEIYRLKAEVDLWKLRSDNWQKLCQVAKEGKPSV